MKYSVLFLYSSMLHSVFCMEKNLFLSNASILTVAGLLIYSQPLCNTRVGRKWKNSELGVCVCVERETRGALMAVLSESPQPESGADIAKACPSQQIGNKHVPRRGAGSGGTRALQQSYILPGTLACGRVFCLFDARPG